MLQNSHHNQIFSKHALNKWKKEEELKKLIHRYLIKEITVISKVEQIQPKNIYLTSIFIEGTYDHLVID